MEQVAFSESERYEPEEGWARAALAGADAVSLEYFEKPPGHSSPMHDHENGQVRLVLRGELRVVTKTDSTDLGQYDSVWLDPWESHRVENPGEDTALGLDIFTPGRSFDFWTDREE